MEIEINNDMPLDDVKKALASAQLGELKKISNSKTWNTQNEIFIKKWGEKAAGLRYMHQNASKRWKSFNDKLVVSSIFLICCFVQCFIG